MRRWLPSFENVDKPRTQGKNWRPKWPLASLCDAAPRVRPYVTQRCGSLCSHSEQLGKRHSCFGMLKKFYQRVRGVQNLAHGLFSNLSLPFWKNFTACLVAVSFEAMPLRNRNFQTHRLCADLSSFPFVASLQPLCSPPLFADVTAKTSRDH